MRSLVHLVVVTCLVVTVAPLQAQQPLTSPPAGMELFNHGLQWKAWSDTHRSIYLDGFVDGQNNTYFALQGYVPESQREGTKRELFTFFGRNAIRDVMTSLYADPANTFIRKYSMVYIARDKLSGKDIEPALRKARANDVTYVEK